MFRCPVCIIAVLLCGCTDSQRHNVTDCRDAALRAGEKYKKEDGWNSKEIHFNRKVSKCYLSLEGIEGLSDDSPNFSQSSVVVDVDENREAISCVMPHIKGQKDTYVCSGPDGKKITSVQISDSNAVRVLKPLKIAEF
jgi:hypothetical protein